MSAPATAAEWKKFICRACGMIYDEQEGDPDSGLAPGTRFEDIPDDWECPLCGVVKADFELYVEAVQTALMASPAVGSPQRGVIIVGAGSAGWSVAEALRTIDSTVPITIVTSCRADRYHKPELSVALSRKLQAESLVRERGQQAAARLSVRLLADTSVVGLSPASRQLRTTRGTLRYTSLVLALGARPMLPAALPAALCWRVNDLAAWSGLQEKLYGATKHIAIIGAGMVGCELADDFVRAGHRVTLLDTQPLPLGGLLPAIAAERLRASFEDIGIRFIGPVQVAGVSAGESGEKRIMTACAQTIEADEVIAATGLATDARFARNAGLAFDRGFEVNSATLQTSVPHVYALGDCITVHGAPCRFIEPIAKQADVIAHAITGRPHGEYQHRPPVIRLKTRTLPIAMHGVPRHAGEWRVIEDSKDHLRMQQWYQGQACVTLDVGRMKSL